MRLRMLASGKIEKRKSKSAVKKGKETPCSGESCTSETSFREPKIMFYHTV